MIFRAQQISSSTSVSSPKPAITMIIRKESDEESICKDVDNKINNSEANLDGPPPRIAPISGVLDSPEVRKVIKPVPFKPYKPYEHSSSNAYVQQLQKSGQHQVQSVAVMPSHRSNDLSPSHHVHVHNTLAPSQRSFASRGTDGSIYSSPYSSLDSENENTTTNSTAIISNGKNMINTSSKIISVSSTNLKRVDSITKSSLSQSQASIPRSCSAVAPEDDHWYMEASMLKMPPAISWDIAAITASRRRPIIYSSEYLSQTPSPNDSIVVELEALVREKDSEISYLRETLERNEQAIFQVYEEKGQSWEREVKKLKSQYEASLRSAEQRAARAENAIAHHKKQSLAERENLMKELEACRKREEALETSNNCLKVELKDLKETVETLKWTLHERNGEVAMLKSQVRDSKVEINQRASEIVGLRKKLKQTNELLDEMKVKSENLQRELQTSQDDSNCQIQSMGQKMAEMGGKMEESSRVIDQLIGEKRDLQNDLVTLQQQLTAQEKSFDEERQTWKDEKEKVLKYQQQLQNNYKKMLTANRILEDLALILRKEGLSKVDEFKC